MDGTDIVNDPRNRPRLAMSVPKIYSSIPDILNTSPRLSQLISLNHVLFWTRPNHSQPFINIDDS